MASSIVAQMSYAPSWTETDMKIGILARCFPEVVHDAAYDLQRRIFFIWALIAFAAIRSMVAREGGSG